jgi:nitrogen regulatory protein PII
MKLLMIVLNREEYFEKVLSLLVEAGVSGATILDSEGLGHFLAYEVPIFAGLRSLMQQNEYYNKTILAVIEQESIFHRFKQLLSKEDIDFIASGVGIIVKIPVEEVIKPAN